MLSFDELFDRRDPYGSFAASLAEPIQSDATAHARGLIDFKHVDYSQTLRDLLACRPGLDLRQVALTATQAEAVLVDVGEVFQLTAANVSMEFAALPKGPEFREWIRKQAQSAVKATVEADAELERGNADIAYPLSDHFASLYEVLEIPLENLRRAAVCVNDLPREQRVPFVRIFLQAIPPGQVVQELQGSLLDVLDAAQTAILALQSQGINELDGPQS